MQHIQIPYKRLSLKYKTSIGVIKLFSGAVELSNLKIKRPLYRFNPSKKNKALKTTIGTLPVYIINPKGNKAIVFFHGGAYIEPPLRFHFSFVEKIAKLTNSKVYFVRYPLAISSNAKRCSEALLDMFLKFPEKEVTLMGDSAGGGLALAIYQLMREHAGVPKVEKIVSICPWLDITLSNPDIESIEKLDFLLDLKQIQEVGKAWQGNLEANNPLCSPLYADIAKDLPLLIISGSKEILAPDIKLFCNKNKDCNIFWQEHMGLHHDFPLFNTKESHKSIITICDFILQ